MSSALPSTSRSCANCRTTMAPGSTHCPACGLDESAASARALARVADHCPQCRRPMRWERSHYICDAPTCRGVFLTCCEGAPQA